MVLPFPARIPVFKAFVFTSLLVLVQLMEHTDPRYSALVFAFFMLSVFAFNTAGGFSRPSGGYIFFFSVLAVDIGTVYKAFTGQAAQTNLQQPLLLMSAHTALMAGMLLAAYLTRMFVKTQDGVAGLMKVREINYSESALGCLVLWIIMTQILPQLPGGGGQILHSLNIVNPFLLLCVFLGTIGAVRNSGGRRSTTPLTIAVLIYMFVSGVLIFSKQGMFTSVVLWVIAASWARFRLRPFHIVSLLAFAIYAQMVLTPMASLRNEPKNDQERWAMAEYYLFHYEALKKHVSPYKPSTELEWQFLYYGKPSGIWDRLSMLPNDSVLVSFSDQGHYFGLKAIRYYFENWVPHIIDPHKLQGVAVGGNAYMHEIGGLADEDYTTGISFSPTAEAYHIAGWYCILVLAPPIYFLLFMTADAVCGDIRRQPWGLITLFTFAHLAPEGGIGGAIGIVWLGNFAIAFAVFCCGYITPVIGSLFGGGVARAHSRAMGRMSLPRPLPRRPLQTS